MKRRNDGRLQKKIRINGKIKYIYAKTPTELKEKYRQAIIEKDIATSDNPFMKDWCEKYLTTYKKNVSPRTYKFYSDIIRLYIVPYIGNFRIKKIKQLDIMNLLNELDKKGITKNKNNTLQLLNSIFNKAIENDLISKNAAAGIKIKQHKSKEKSVIPQEIINKLIENIDDKDCFMFLFLIYTGLRRSELVPLTPFDIDFKHKVIKIDKAIYFSHNQPVIKPTKNGEARFVPILDVIYNNLYSLAEKMPNFLFSNAKEGMMSEQSLKRKLEKVKKIVNYNFSYHECRHTFISLMYNAGIEVKQAQAWSGHKDIRVLLDIYTHLSEQHTSESFDKLNKWVSKRLSKQ